MDGMPHITTATPMARLARALAAPNAKDWTIQGKHDGKLVMLRHRDDVAIQIDRGQRRLRACRMFVETEVLHSGKALGGFCQTTPEVVRTWIPFGDLPLPPTLPSGKVGLRDALVDALDRAVGPAAERRLQAARARLALDLVPFRDDAPDPQRIGWHLCLETGEIYGPRKTLDIRQDAAREALMDTLKDVCVMRHGLLEKIVNIGIPEIDSAHARADATALAAAGGLAEPLTLTIV
jgi:hypothetical protein